MLRAKPFAHVDLALAVQPGAEIDQLRDVEDGIDQPSASKRARPRWSSSSNTSREKRAIRPG
jgi:hypothetical protein